MKIIESTYDKVLSSLPLEPQELKPEVLFKQIKNDLLRIPFIDLNGKTYVHYEQNWLTTHNTLNCDVSYDYLQGNMTGSCFSELLYQKHILADNPELGLNKKTLAFSYLDDEGCPCGFSLTFDKENTKFYVATIIRNTNKKPGERSVIIETSITNEPTLQEEVTLSSIADKTGSVSVSILINVLINKNGNINGSKSQDLIKELKPQNSNGDIVFKYLDPRKPLMLNPVQLVLANLQNLTSLGFSIEEHFFQVIPNDGNTSETAPSLYQYWTAIKGDCQIVFFAPSKDIDVIYAMSPGMESMPYLLDTQKIAQAYVDKGFSCFIPVAEYAPMQPLHQPGINELKGILSQGFSFFSDQKGKESSLEKSILARMHWVTLIWNKEQLRFFDPKSSQAYLVKYDNGRFKEFAENAGYRVEGKKNLIQQQKDTQKGWYGAVKEPHPQRTLEVIGNSKGQRVDFVQ